MQNNKLGRGFDSLIPKNFDSSILASDDERIKKIDISLLEPNPEQPRLHFDEQALQELADSIKQHGILQPLVVTPNNDKYYIIAGERRWRAAKIAGLKTVPAVSRSSKQLERLELALVENVQRVNLSPLEQAASIQYLHDQFSLDYITIGSRLGKAAVTVQNTARLLQLPKQAIEALGDKKISEGHARTILALKDEKDQLVLLQLIIKNEWSVRQAERYVVAHKKGTSTSASAIKKVATVSPQTEKLTKILKTKVSLKRTAKGGKLEIGFKNDTELKRIVNFISKKQ
ncbi:MAG: ParB/RepB/Spo0J family partition protein [Candidatus Saccharibacteria bacterium]|nr:ParB/RepB/Spo0J family partition protein [Candidatus Saccharibacteria bacterium]